MADTIELKYLHLAAFDNQEYVKAEKAILENLRAHLELAVKKLNADEASLIKSEKNTGSLYALHEVTIKEIYESRTKILNTISSINQTLEIIDDSLKDNINDIQFRLYPQLWQNTSRVANKIAVPNQPDDPSLFDFVENYLKDELKKIPFSVFENTDSEARNAIKFAQKSHEILRKQTKRQFLFGAKNGTANELCNFLEGLKANPGAEVHQLSSLIIETRKIANLKTHEETNDPKTDDSLIETSKDCLVANRDVHNLAIKLKECADKIQDEQERNKLIALATQLDETTKRWLDPHFKNPTKLTALDKFRYGLKIASTILCLLSCVVALVLLFTPFAPLSPIVGMVGLLGLSFLGDTLISSIYCKVVYKRNMLRTQKMELVGTVLAAPIFALITQASVFFHTIPTVLRSISDGIRNYGSSSLNILGNIFYTGLLGHTFLSYFKPRALNSQDLKKPIVHQPTDAKNILLKMVAPNLSKTPSLSSSQHSLWEERNKIARTQSVYNFKNAKGAAISSPSHHFEIKQWLAAAVKIKNSELFSICSSVDAYIRMDSDTSSKVRKDEVDYLIRMLPRLHGPSSENSKIKQLSDELSIYLMSEKASLDSIPENSPVIMSRR